MIPLQNIQVHLPRESSTASYRLYVRFQDIEKNFSFFPVTRESYFPSAPLWENVVTVWAHHPSKFLANVPERTASAHTSPSVSAKIDSSRFVKSGTRRISVCPQ
jgi:hypothetical protein